LQLLNPHTRWIALAALIAGVAIAACGGEETRATTTGPVAMTQTTTAAPAASAATDAKVGHLSLAHRPLVVAIPRRAGEGTPSLGVYFKLTRALTHGHRVAVAVDGVANVDTTGTGYDSRRGRCYYKLLDNTDDFPQSLRTVKAGQRVTVKIGIQRASPRTLEAKVPVAIAEPGEDEAVPTPRWLRRLGC
jgi:hypothetical protein